MVRHLRIIHIHKKKKKSYLLTQLCSKYSTGTLSTYFLKIKLEYLKSVIIGSVGEGESG